MLGESWWLNLESACRGCSSSSMPLGRRVLPRLPWGWAKSRPHSWRTSWSSRPFRACTKSRQKGLQTFLGPWASWRKSTAPASVARRLSVRISARKKLARSSVPKWISGRWNIALFSNADKYLTVKQTVKAALWIGSPPFYIQKNIIN